MEILQTSNYDRFTTLKGNRIINEQKVNSLIGDIEAGLNLLPYCPIIVTETKEKVFVILDGQHRFTACLRMKHEIHYVVAKDISLRDLARMNSRQDKWKSSDFMDCYIEIGIADYEVLKDFMEKNELIYSLAASLLSSGHTNDKESMDNFRDGVFKVKYLDEAQELMDVILDVFGRYRFFNKRYFIAAIIDIRKANVVDWEVMKSKVKVAPNLLDFQTNKKEWILNLEKLYNYRNSKRVCIF